MGKHEDPIHLFALGYLSVKLPDAVVHHSPNESPSARYEGWRMRQGRMGTRSGWPDIEVIHKGRALFLEIKGPKGKPTEAQTETMMALGDAGASVYLCRSPEDVQAAVARFLEVVDA